MKEVSGRLFALAADIAGVGAVDDADLFRSLDVPRVREAGTAIHVDPAARASFQDFVALLDRLRDRLGGDQALSDAFARSPLALPELLVFATDFTSPLELSRFFNTVLLPGYFTCLHTVMSPTGDAAYDLWLVLHPDYTASRSLVAALAGIVRGLPRHLDLGEAEVTVGDGSREILCQVQLPAGRGKARGRAKMRAEDNARANTFIDALVVDGGAFRGGASQGEALLRTIGEAALRAPGRTAFAGLVVDAFARILGLGGCALWEPGGSVCRAEAGKLPTERLMLDVVIAGTDAGRLDLPLHTSREVVDLVLPLIAWGLTVHGADEPAREDPRAPLLRVLPEWKLTKRQAEVVALVVAGLSNGEIAARLGCAIGTIEDRLTTIYAKVGVDGRLSLAVRVGAVQPASAAAGVDN